MPGKYHYTLARLDKESTDALEAMYDHLLELVHPRNPSSYEVSAADYWDISYTIRRIDLLIRSRASTARTSAGAPNDR